MADEKVMYRAGVRHGVGDQIKCYIDANDVGAASLSFMQASYGLPFRLVHRQKREEKRLLAPNRLQPYRPRMLLHVVS
jgi:hypothetical protein